MLDTTNITFSFFNQYSKLSIFLTYVELNLYYYTVNYMVSSGTYTYTTIQKHVHEFHSVTKFSSHHYNKLCVEECILADLLFYYCLVPSVKQIRPFSSKCSLTDILLQLLDTLVPIHFKIAGMPYWVLFPVRTNVDRTANSLPLLFLR